MSDRFRGYLAPGERAEEKRLSREKDAADLASGVKTAADLAKENGHFAGLKVRMRDREVSFDFAETEEEYVRRRMQECVDFFCYTPDTADRLIAIEASLSAMRDDFKRRGIQFEDVTVEVHVNGKFVVLKKKSTDD